MRGADSTQAARRDATHRIGARLGALRTRTHTTEGGRHPRCSGRSTLSGTPFGRLVYSGGVPGVVAALNPRLMSGTPAGEGRGPRWDPAADVVFSTDGNPIDNFFRGGAWVGTLTWGRRRCAVTTPGSGRNPLQGLGGPGVGVRNDAGRGDKPPGLSVKQVQSTTRQACGSIRWFSWHGRPEAYPTDVATNLQVCRNRGRYKIVFVAVVCLAG
jgi:hypothetical protein